MTEEYTQDKPVILRDPRGVRFLEIFFTPYPVDPNCTIHLVEVTQRAVDLILGEDLPPEFEDPYPMDRHGRHMYYNQKYGISIGRALYALEHGIADEDLYLGNRTYKTVVESFFCSLALSIQRKMIPPTKD